MKDDLDKIRAAQRQLDAADTKLGDYLVAIEEALRGIVKVRISTVLDTEHSLEFGKHHGSWRLVVVGPDDKSCPIASCSRELRAKLVLDGSLERLLRDAAAQLDAMIADRQRAIAEALRLIGVLDAAKVAAQADD